MVDLPQQEIALAKRDGALLEQHLEVLVRGEEGRLGLVLFVDILDHRDRQQRLAGVGRAHDGGRHPPPNGLSVFAQITLLTNIGGIFPVEHTFERGLLNVPVFVEREFPAGSADEFVRLVSQHVSE